jgi:hypothetical protein
LTFCPLCFRSGQVAFDLTFFFAGSSGWLAEIGKRRLHVVTALTLSVEKPTLKLHYE